VNLAALLYAALVGRWPGTEGSSVPAAPAEHGRALRPRQVRAGVPRPLDAICERVLNAGPHNHAVPIETAHEVYAALSDFIGDPTGAPSYDTTSILGPDDLAFAHGDPDAGLEEGPWAGSEAADLGPATQLSPAAQPDGGLDGDTVWAAPDHVGGDTGADAARTDGGDPGETGELAATGAMDAVDDAAAERTQAGTPVFFDEDTGVGWMSDGDSRGLRSDGTDSRQAPVSAGPRPSSAPPPPLPDLPERPLFADGPRPAGSGNGSAVAGSWGPEERSDGVGRPGAGGRDPGEPRDSGSARSVTRPPSRPPSRGADQGDDTGGFLRSTGFGGGSMPSSWGPDPDEDDEPEEWDDERPGRRWLTLAAVVAGLVALVIGLVFAFNLGRGGGGANSASGSSSASTSRTAAPPRPVKITGVTDFDPQADPPEENPDLAPLAIDGKPGTAWQTMTYQNNPKLGGLKSGVGLLVDLGRKTRVGSVKLALLGSPTSLQLLAAPDAQAAPSSTDGLPVVASRDGAGTRVTLRLRKPVRTQWLVVWLTSLPPAPSGGYQGKVAEISVVS